MPAGTGDRWGQHPPPRPPMPSGESEGPDSADSTRQAGSAHPHTRMHTQTPSLQPSLISLITAHKRKPQWRGVSPPPHKSPPPIHCCDKPRPLRRAGTRVMRQEQGGRGDTVCKHHLGLIFSAGGTDRGTQPEDTPSWVLLVRACTPGAGPALIEVSCVPSPAVTVSPRPPHPPSSRAVPALPLGAQGTSTSHTHPHCVHTRAHSCTPHVQPASRMEGGCPFVCECPPGHRKGWGAPWL